MNNSLFKISAIINETSKIIIDLDYDFFFDSEDHISSNPWKKRSKNFIDFYNKHSFLSFTPLIGHDEAFDLWTKNGFQNTTCIHIDHHHDLHISENSLFSKHENQFSDELNCANYLYFAVRKNIIDNIIWVYPDKKLDIEKIKLFDSFLKIGKFFCAIPYSKYQKYIYKNLLYNKNKIISSCIAISPDFVKKSDIDFLFKKIKCDTEKKYRAYDYAFESIILQENEKSIIRFPAKLKKTSHIYFHGSSRKDLKILNKKKNYISTSAGFACCYSLKLFNNKFWTQGIENIFYDKETVFVIPKNSKFIKQLKNKSFLYTLNLEKKKVSTGNIENFIKICNSNLSVIKQEQFNSTYDSFKKYKVKSLQYNLYSKLFLEHISNTSNKFFRWMSMTKDSIRKYPSSYFFFSVYKCINDKNKKIKNYEFIPIIYWKRFIIYILLANKSRLGFDIDPYHGLTHSLEVAELALMLAYIENENPLYVLFSALSHDINKSNANNYLNVVKSNEKLKYFFKNEWNEYYNENILNNASLANLNHINNQPTKHKASLILRDSDRYRLAWERGYQSKYFKTKLGKNIAKRDLIYLKSFKEVFYFTNQVSLDIRLSEKKKFIIYLRHYNNKRKLSTVKLISKYNIILTLIKYNIKEMNIYNNIKLSDSLIRILKNLDIKIINICDTEKSPEKFTYENNIIMKDFKKYNSLRNIKANYKTSKIYFEINKTNYNNIINNLNLIINNKFKIKLYVNYNYFEQNNWLISFLKNLLNIKKNNSYLRELLIYGNIPWCITKDIKYIFTCLAPRKNNIFNKFNYHDIITDRGFIKKNISDLDSRYQHCEHCLYFHSCGSFNLQNKAQILKKLKGYKKTFNKKNFLYY